MKNIAYIELDTHAEIVNSFLDLIDFSTRFKVDYFLSPKVLKLVEHRKEENIYVSNTEILLEQLAERKYDLVIIGTVHRYFNTFTKVNSLYNTAIITHNINFIKRSKYALLKAVLDKDQGFRFKLLALEGLLSMTKVYQNANYLLVLGNRFSCKRKIYLPLFYTRFFEKSENKILQVVIPGIVSQQRRNYKEVLAQLQNFKSQMEVIFLGKASGEELIWLEEAAKNVPENIELKFFTKKISAEKFDQYMKSADVLWCPIQQETEFFSGKEIYGQTKLSGNIGDAIRYGKAAIFPKEYQGDYPFIYAAEREIERQLVHVATEKVDFSGYGKEIILKNLEHQLDLMMAT